MNASELELVARCANGFEAALAGELRAMGIRRVRPLRGSVAFFGTQRDAYRACLWSRVATRVQLVLARIPAADADQLYQGVASFPWEKHVRDGATVAVQAHGTNAHLRNTQFTAFKVKDGLCDRLRDVRGSRPDVDAKRPGFSVSVALHEQRATLCLNLSGESLHRRGYRQDGVQTEAPLKETLAAGILLVAGWDQLARQGGILVDPMCGSGTLAVEGALIAADVAPGLLRARWGFEGWVRHDRQLWQELLNEARQRKEAAAPRARVLAGDLDPQVIEVARYNADRAGIGRHVQFFVDDAARLSRHLRYAGDAPGLLVANPPYGIRLLSQSELPKVYASLGAAVRSLPEGWEVALITPDPGVDTALGRMPAQTIPCFNGPIETWVRVYSTDEGAQSIEVVTLGGVRREVSVADPSSVQFAKRLRKMAKERARWARGEHVSCYRVYDADLPDYALSVDLYRGAQRDAERRFAVVEERPRPKSVDAQRAGRHFADAVALTSAILEVPVADIVQKPWVSDALYARGDDAASRMACVEEDGYHIMGDLMGPVGRCLPLSQREVRRLVGSQAGGLRFANLFASANAATVAAAGAGARTTVTVDVSQERLAWLELALRENGLFGKAHRLARVDVLTWLTREANAHHTYDLMLCAPPSRLVAHGEHGRDWDLQRDLPTLLGLLAKVLAPEGSVILLLPNGFSFERKLALACGFFTDDYSDQMVPHDFRRAAGLGSCWHLSRSE